MSDAELKINSRAYNFLVLNISHAFLRDTKGIVRAKEAWEVLQDACTKQGFLHYLDLMGELFEMKMNEGESMRAYIESF